MENKRMYFVGKRLFDLVASLFGMVLLSPLFLIIALIIKLDSPEPVIYKQTRVGREERTFEIFKFRTMVENGDKDGLQLTLKDDKRITRVGRFLRKYKLDEFPQLINVFRGEMSLVGPRPEVPRYVAFYGVEEREFLKLKPGITDYASIAFKDENQLLLASQDPERTYIEEIMPEKFSLNRKYLENLSLTQDFKIILLTIKALIFD